MENNIQYKVAEIELVYKTAVKASERPVVKRAADAYKIFLNSWDDNKIGFVEQFKILLLNRSNKVLGICEISTGGVSATVVDAKVLFAAAIKANASGIILCHNHPSGSLKPSVADQQLTNRLKEGAQLLELQIIEHLIVTEEGYFSFAEEGYI